MKLNINSIELENFKGVRNAKYDFGSKTMIFGQNGTGKTTIFTAFTWLFADKDTELNSNPDIRRVGEVEATPIVTLNCHFDGKPVQLRKMQKRAVSKPNADGVSKVTLSNSYEINSVPKSEKDFKAYLEDLGFKFETFLACAMTDVFTSQKKDEMRKVLFSMVSNVTDKDIADKISDEIPELAKLLENYSVEEIKAMQNATIRKIKEDYGKDGEILRAKVDGLLSAKVDVDLAENELRKNAIDEKSVETNKIKQSLNQYDMDIETLRSKILDLKFQRSEAINLANRELEQEISAAERLESEAYTELEMNNRELDYIKRDLARAESTKATRENEIESIKKDHAKIKAKAFDNSTCTCPTCKREFDESKKAEIKAEFETGKKNELHRIVELANQVNAQYKDVENEIISLKQKINETQSNCDVCKKKLEEVSGKVKELKQRRNVTELPKTVTDIDGEIRTRELKIGELQETISKETETYNNLLEIINNENEEIQAIFSAAKLNTKIDEQVENLRKKQMEYEQAKANAENVLYQITVLEKSKNETLSDEINSHFNLVKFRLWETQKNGEIKDACIPMIDGKELKVATNNALTIRGQIDVCSGLQNFFEQNLPIFLDNAESLDLANQNAINTGSQLILLCVSESKELKVVADND